MARWPRGNGPSERCFFHHALASCNNAFLFVSVYRVRPPCGNLERRFFAFAGPQQAAKKPFRQMRKGWRKAARVDSAASKGNFRGNGLPTLPLSRAGKTRFFKAMRSRRPPPQSGDGTLLQNVVKIVSTDFIVWSGASGHGSPLPRQSRPSDEQFARKADACVLTSELCSYYTFNIE